VGIAWAGRPSPFRSQVYHTFWPPSITLGTSSVRRLPAAHGDVRIFSQRRATPDRRSPNHDAVS